MTNRILLALNAVLLLAVAFLFYKVYSGPAEPEAAAPKTAVTAKVEADADDSASAGAQEDEPAQTSAPVLAAGGGEGIYYVNTDTLLAKYKVFKNQSAALEAKSRRLEQELARRANAFQQEQAEAMQKLQAGQMNQAQEVLDVPFVTHPQPAKRLEPGITALHAPLSTGA